jgi:hypothetical protein
MLNEGRYLFLRYEFDFEGGKRWNTQKDIIENNIPSEPFSFLADLPVLHRDPDWRSKQGISERSQKEVIFLNISETTWSISMIFLVERLSGKFQ